jgi:hypothetical protein
VILVGAVLSTTDGKWNGLKPITYDYRWRRNNVNISGAIAATYTTVPADIGALISCLVTATNADGSSSSISNQIGPISAPDIPVNAVAPTIADFTPQAAETLTCNPGTWYGTAPITFSYEWYETTDVLTTEGD